MFENEDDLALAALGRQLQVADTVRNLTNREIQALVMPFRWRARGGKYRIEGDSGPRLPYREEVLSRAEFLAYRFVRWMLMGLGWSSVADPLAFATQIHAQRSPQGPLGIWVEPLPRRTLHQTSATQPGLFALQRALNQHPAGLFLQPPAPEAPLDQKFAFTEALRVACEALLFRAETSEDMHLGLQILDPAEIANDLYPDAGDDVPYFSDEIYEVICANFPGPEKLLAFEQGFLTSLAEALSDTGEDQLRMWIRTRWGMTDFEAFSMAQTAKQWAAALRPINLDVERALLIRNLEQAGNRARLAMDHRGEIAAAQNRAKILGLMNQVGTDHDEAFGEAAESTFETSNEDRTKFMLADRPPTLEEYQGMKYREKQPEEQDREG